MVDGNVYEIGRRWSVRCSIKVDMYDAKMMT